MGPGAWDEKTDEGPSLQGSLFQLPCGHASWPPSVRGPPAAAPAGPGGAASWSRWAATPMNPIATLPVERMPPRFWSSAVVPRQGPGPQRTQDQQRLAQKLESLKGLAK